MSDKSMKATKAWALVDEQGRPYVNSVADSFATVLSNQSRYVAYRDFHVAEVTVIKTADYEALQQRVKKLEGKTCQWSTGCDYCPACGVRINSI